MNSNQINEHLMINKLLFKPKYLYKIKINRQKLRLNTGKQDRTFFFAVRRIEVKKVF